MSLSRKTYLVNQSGLLPVFAKDMLEQQLLVEHPNMHIQTKIDSVARQGEYIQHVHGRSTPCLCAHTCKAYSLCICLAKCYFSYLVLSCERQHTAHDMYMYNLTCSCMFNDSIMYSVLPRHYRSDSEDLLLHPDLMVTEFTRAGWAVVR